MIRACLLALAALYAAAPVSAQPQNAFGLDRPGFRTPVESRLGLVAFRGEIAVMQVATATAGDFTIARYDPETGATAPLARLSGGVGGESTALCLWQEEGAPVTVFVGDDQGMIGQSVLLFDEQDADSALSAGAPPVSIHLLRRLATGSAIVDCVVDDSRGALYVALENGEIRRFDANPPGDPGLGASISDLASRALALADIGAIGGETVIEAGDIDGEIQRLLVDDGWIFTGQTPRNPDGPRYLLVERTLPPSSDQPPLAFRLPDMERVPWSSITTTGTDR